MELIKTRKPSSSKGVKKKTTGVKGRTSGSRKTIKYEPPENVSSVENVESTTTHSETGEVEPASHSNSIKTTSEFPAVIRTDEDSHDTSITRGKSEASG